MAGNIKGLTVEIGGDTTKLGKALENVNKKSKDLSTELGQINRLLKLDPGNTELLAQKQKVLADAVENTAKKLDTLKKAEKQVQKQFERGEASEEQVRALQREIISTSNKLETYERAARETAEAVERLGQESESAGNSMGEVAGNANDFAGSAKNAEKESGKLGGTLGGVVKTGFAALVGLLGAAVAGLTAAAEATRDYRKEMGKLNSAFSASGHSTSTASASYKELVGVIGETDQSVEAAQQIALLAKSEEDVAKWASYAAGIVGRFGDALQPETFYESANETMKLGEATGAFTQMLEGCGYSVEHFNAGLAACATEEEKQAYMLGITEKCLGAAGEAYRENNADIIEANKATDNWMQALSGVGGAIEPIITDVKNLGAALLGEAVPGIKKLADAFRGLYSGDAGASGDFAAALSGLVSGLVEKITQALPNIARVGGTIIITLASSLLQQIPLLLTTAGQIITQLVHGISTYLPTVVSKGAEILGNLGQGIQNALPGLISRGLDIAMELVTALYDAAPGMIEAGAGFIKNLVQGLMNSLPTLLSKAPELISKFVNILNHNVPSLLKHGMDIIIMIGKGIIAAIPALIQNAGAIVQMIVDVWQAINWLNIGKNVFTALKNGLTSMGGALKSAGQKAGQWIMDALKNLPGQLLKLGKNAITWMKNGISSMAGSIRAAGGNILRAAVNAIKALPGRLMNLGKNAITFLGNAFKSGQGILRQKATALLNSVVNVIKTLPNKVLNIGTQMVQGIYKGITSSTQWIKDRIKEWVGNVTDFLKKVFKIGSPSRLMADEIGRHLPSGIAVGVEANTKTATDAMKALSQDMVAAGQVDVGGLNFERNLTRPTRPGSAAYGAAAAAMTDGAALLSALDRIYERLDKLQVVLDSGAMVGALTPKIDKALATRQVLASRGV